MVCWCVRVWEDNIANDYLVKVNLAQDNLVQDNLAQDNLSQHNLSQDNLSQDNLAQDNLARDNQLVWWCVRVWEAAVEGLPIARPVWQRRRGDQHLFIFSQK